MSLKKFTLMLNEFSGLGPLTLGPSVTFTMTQQRHEAELDAEVIRRHGRFRRHQASFEVEVPDSFRHVRPCACRSVHRPVRRPRAIVGAYRAEQPGIFDGKFSNFRWLGRQSVM